MCCRILMSLVLCTYAVNAIPQLLVQCSSRNNIDKFMNCAVSKVLKTVALAESQKNFEIIPGLTLERNSSVPRTPKELNPELLENSTNQTSKLFDLLFQATARFMNDRVLKIEIPLNSTASMGRSLVEGRGKMKKMMGFMSPLILGLGAKMMSMVPILFGGIFLLAAKALVVGKIALALSALLFVQFFFNGRLFSYGGGTYGIPTTYGVPTTTYGTNFGTNSIGGGWGTAGQYPYA